MPKRQKRSLIKLLDPADSERQRLRAVEHAAMSQEWAADEPQTVGNTAVRRPGFDRQNERKRMRGASKDEKEVKISF